MKPVGRFIALGVIAVLSTGCFRAEIDLTVAADNTVSGTALLAYERAALNELDRNADDARDELLGDLEIDAPGGMTCEPWEDDEFIGARCTLDRVTFDELSLTDTFQQEIVLVREADLMRLFGVVDLSDVPVGDPELIDAFDVRIRVTFPGAVISQQNGEVDGQTVTWTLPPGEPTAIAALAEATPEGGPFPIGLAIGIALALALILTVMAVRRRRAKAKTS